MCCGVGVCGIYVCVCVGVWSVCACECVYFTVYVGMLLGGRVGGWACVGGWAGGLAYIDVGIHVLSIMQSSRLSLFKVAVSTLIVFR